MSDAIGKDSGTVAEDVTNTGEDFVEFSRDDEPSDRVYISVPNYQLARPAELAKSPSKPREVSNHPIMRAPAVSNVLSKPTTVQPRRAPTRKEKRNYGRFLINVKNIMWTMDERTALISALRKYGMFDIESLCKEVPSKTKPEILEFINMSWKVTQRTIASHEKEEDAQETPIAQWLNALEDAAKEGGNRSSAYNLMLPKVFLYLSKFGNHPNPNNCEGINYSEAYEYIYHMLSGLPGKTLNPETTRLVRTTLQCLSIRARNGSNDQLEFIGKIQGVPSPSVVRPSARKNNTAGSGAPDDRTDRNALKEILKLPEANPLNIPITMLEFRTNMQGL